MCVRSDTPRLWAVRRCGGAAVREALPLVVMTFAATQVGLFAAELEARGFVAGIGKFILIVIIVLVIGGALLGFAVGRRR
jgi:fumarate reductase subunit D